jgi:hypothetical protein
MDSPSAHLECFTLRIRVDDAETCPGTPVPAIWLAGWAARCENEVDARSPEGKAGNAAGGGAHPDAKLALHEMSHQLGHLAEQEWPKVRPLNTGHNGQASPSVSECGLRRGASRWWNWGCRVRMWPVSGNVRRTGQTFGQDPDRPTIWLICTALVEDRPRSQLETVPALGELTSWPPAFA